VPVIVDELRRAGEDISQDELNRARAQYRAGLMMSHESASARASQIARQMLLFGRPISTEELVQRIDAVSVDRVRGLADKIFTGSAPTVAAIGPIDRLVDRDRIAERLGSRVDA